MPSTSEHDTPTPRFKIGDIVTTERVREMAGPITGYAYLAGRFVYRIQPIGSDDAARSRYFAFEDTLTADE